MVSLSIKSLISRVKILQSVNLESFSKIALDYVVPVLGAVLVFFLHPHDSRLIGDLAQSILGGLIGFVGLVFAIISLTAETGAIAGIRAIRSLTRNSSAFLLRVAITILASAICLFHPSRIFGSLLTLWVLFVIFGLPRFVNQMSNLASPAALAKDLQQRIVRLQQREKRPGIIESSLGQKRIADEIDSLLNDLRQSSIKLWQNGDIEGFSILADAFLNTIPTPSERRILNGDIRQLKFLRTWIQLLSKDSSALVFLAGRQRRRIILAIQSDDNALATALLEMVISIVSTVMTNEDHQEFHIRSLEIVKEIGDNITEISKVDSGLLVQQLMRLNDLILLEFNRQLVIGENDNLSHGWSLEGLKVWVEARLSLSVALQKTGTQFCAEDFQSLSILILQVGNLGAHLSEDSISQLCLLTRPFINEIESDQNPLVYLFATLCASFKSLVNDGHVRLSSRLLEEVIAPIASMEFDDGTERYYYHCVSSLRHQIPRPSISHFEILNIESSLAVKGMKEKDIRESIPAVLAYCASTHASRRDVKTLLSEMCSALLAISRRKTGVPIASLGGISTTRFNSVKAMCMVLCASQSRYQLTPEMSAAVSLLRLQVLDLLRQDESSSERPDFAIIDFLILQQIQLIASSCKAGDTTKEKRYSKNIGLLRLGKASAMTIPPEILEVLFRTSKSIVSDFVEVPEVRFALPVLAYQSHLLMYQEGPRADELRALSFLHFTSLLTRFPNSTLFKAGQIEAARVAAIPHGDTVDYKTLQYIYTALVDIARYAVQRPSEITGLPGPKRARELIQLLSKHGPKPLSPIETAAMRETYVLQRNSSDKRGTYFEERIRSYSDQLRAGRLRFVVMENSDRQLLKEAHFLAISWDRDLGNTLDSAEFAFQMAMTLTQTIDTANKTCGERSHDDLIRLLQEGIWCLKREQESAQPRTISRRSQILLLATITARDSIKKLYEITSKGDQVSVDAARAYLVELIKISFEILKFEPDFDLEALVEAMGELHSELDDLANAEHDFLNSDIVTMTMASAALVVLRRLRAPTDTNVPVLSELLKQHLLVGPVAPDSPASRGGTMRTASEVSRLAAKQKVVQSLRLKLGSEDRLYVVSTFDWLVDHLKATSTDETRLAYLWDRIEIRQNYSVIKGLGAALQALTDEGFNGAASQIPMFILDKMFSFFHDIDSSVDDIFILLARTDEGRAAIERFFDFYLLAFVNDIARHQHQTSIFGRFLHGPLSGNSVDGLIPSILLRSGEGEDDPDRREQFGSVRSILEKFVADLLLECKDRRLTSAIRAQFVRIRRQVPVSDSEVSDFLDGQLKRWNPYWSPSSSFGDEELLPNFRLRVKPLALISDE